MKTSIIRGGLAAALLAAPAQVFAFIPQASSGATAVSAQRVGGVRGGRCATCSDSARVKHELLLNKLDSLRLEFINRRLTRVEQDSFAREIDLTLTALRQVMEQNGARVRLVPGARAEAMAGSAASGGGEAYTYTVQVTKRGY
ncbi:MAG TPA: hypothetical protein VF483_09975, partial [Gemmatimonadaceae bacterium]